MERLMHELQKDMHMHISEHGSKKKLCKSELRMKLIGRVRNSLLLLFLFSQIIFAGGTNRASLFGAKTTALNGMYFAGADGVTNIFLNPAGLVQLSGKSLELTCFLVQEEQVFKSDINNLHKSLLEGDANIGLGIYWAFTPNFTAAFAYQSTFDYNVSWPNVLLYKNGNSATTVATDLFNVNKYRIFSPSISVKWDELSFGLAVNIINIKNNISFAQNNYVWTGSNGLPAYQLDYSQNAWAVDFNFGLTYQYNENLTLGLTANNGVSKTLKGDARSKLYELTDSTQSTSGIESKFQIPWKIGFGCLYKIDKNIALNVDFRYNLYGNLDEKRDFKFDNETWQSNVQIPDTVIGITASNQPLFLKNSFDAGLGLEYQLYSDFSIYLGYRFSQTPNSDQTFNMLNPTVSHHTFSCGFGYSDDEMTIEGSVAYYTGVEKTISESMFNVNNGIYDASGAIPTFTLKYKF